MGNINGSMGCAFSGEDEGHVGHHSRIRLTPVPEKGYRFPQTKPFNVQSFQSNLVECFAAHSSSWVAKRKEKSLGRRLAEKEHASLSG